MTLWRDARFGSERAVAALYLTFGTSLRSNKEGPGDERGGGKRGALRGDYRERMAGVCLRLKRPVDSIRGGAFFRARGTGGNECRNEWTATKKEIER